MLLTVILTEKGALIYFLVILVEKHSNLTVLDNGLRITKLQKIKTSDVRY